MQAQAAHGRTGCGHADGDRRHHCIQRSTVQGIDETRAGHADRDRRRGQPLSLGRGSHSRDRLDTPGTRIETRRTVSGKFHVPIATEADVVGRWFAGGRTCDFALIFKQHTH